mmetsp:Transcript_17168/g.59692  ORF Transcript_17168/g.59692 Transcript_17168/m.59692 type:complete len:84 (-) Transcript_17168:392-643(-)
MPRRMCTYLGNAYQIGGNGLKASSKRAVQVFERAAAQGHALAQILLGNCYEFGAASRSTTRPPRCGTDAQPSKDFLMRNTVSA